MSCRELFIRGDFPSTNTLLDQQRADGFLAGRRHGNRQWIGPPPERSYAAIAKRIRETTWAAARQAGLQRFDRAELFFVLFDSGKTDPDAWMLAAKLVLDGLADAKVLADGDRFSVVRTGGTTAPVEAAVVVPPWVGPQRWRCMAAGMLVLLREVPDGL